ncbi:hypothetical protein A2W67_02740 [Candidatus Nomurabacteria bacterium RIFCSPLOWO2_02_40_28]|uniref:DUF3105 domain-containing protein n=2 Tax=Candidatus Nomuraibacteriota TaxID=1752729 RepID=A0A837HVX0_9BACT|nr:MAG: hypothetical protein UT27_C0007G0057 [Candidatus Nomurabacteria bacterium GW2011_GWD2_39_12]KKR20401.1 MAG: hypothetical protein UT51_C0004G0060 [Candidatus Nomurabacteria bacterium GW2011_GWC2_39_41]KKR37118.1 MAG: hypothetical protein UT70_C0003G0060 [Candidatus Nomurabacteria bacterium GW2011_GWE2_40_10]KKR38271.1 MAG: hypothetical protein UT73_C0004G0016 [Candidatus Nomurabacteria bacterium GW2011_GWB1_40_11]KKR39843.1 MAG: hypothetical protein UT74_C0005G0060 [Parcubacteria group b
MKKFTIIIAISFLAVGFLVFWSLNQDKKLSRYKAITNTENLGPIGQVFENQGQTHIKPNEPHPAYNSNPPTSGWHWLNPASWGVYNRPLIDEQAVHNLEHGGIWISYKDIDEGTLENLKKIAKANAQSVILSPREANDTKIILASWTRLEKMQEYNEAKILEFISRNKNNSPEPFAK